MAQTIESFVAKWAASGAAERANKDLFLTELCDVLDVPRPNPTTGDPENDTYVFERDALVPHEGGTITVGKIDLYKAGHFILEAKQGSDATSKKLGTAKRGTAAWNVAMMGAYGQALGYARSFDKAVPFLVTCDIGHCFDLYAAFDGSWNYRPFPNAQANRIFLADLAKHADMLRRVLVEPHTLDPSKHAAKVTRDVAAHLAELAKALEEAGHAPEGVATFLMRCIFTMFAEDVGLLPERLFTDAVEKLWLENPPSFPGGIESLWRAMNAGGDFGFVGKLLRFNGGLFAQPTALPLTKDHLKLLLEAAKCDWAGVEPAIFGTLLERALDPKERHALGAHFTPRAYVERLVRPTIEEPLRADWEIVQAEIRELVAADKVEAAKKVVKAFHQKLCHTRVLDPACGSGNFLYVTLDLFKRLEGEVIALLEGLGEKQTLLHVDTIRVTPAQFLGIEIKRWAKEIAELVLWIGYLQHHFRTYGKNITPPEPVLQDYKNIECRDAVLAYDAEELVRDEKGAPVTRWDGETYKKSPVTGEDVPDETARVPEYRYLNPKPAAWPKADFVVGNPPFVANRNMRRDLGDGYVDALTLAYHDVGEAIDFVMYFWSHAAQFVRAKETQRAGFITTNSIRMIRNQTVVRRVLDEGCRIIFAIPDHPWPATRDAAKVRVSMSVLANAETDRGMPRLLLAEGHDQVAKNRALSADLGEGDLTIAPCQAINADLSPGVSIDNMRALRAVSGLDNAGMKPYARTLIISETKALELFPDDDDRRDRAPPYRNGKDIAGGLRGVHVLDFFGLGELEIATRYPAAYQYLVDYVKPERSQDRDLRARTEWWLFQRNRPELRRALGRLRRYIVTVENSPTRYFVFVDAGICPDQKLRVVAHDDAFVLGVLSARPHVAFSQRAGGHQGVANTPVYNTRCITWYPFPACADPTAKHIRELGERLDAHRKARQGEHSDLAVTGMYNVLAKLRSGEPLTAKDKVIHEQGLVSVLKQLHDDLDAAVFDAYGWPHNLTDEQILERLVALNAERAEEERKGLIRWLRPDFQNPGGKTQATQVDIAGVEETEAGEDVTAPAAVAWPKKLPERVAAVRDLLVRGSSGWTAAQVAASFKGAKAKDAEQVLDSLAALGLLVAYEAGGKRTWKAAARVAA